jgi:hypothetical protein
MNKVQKQKLWSELSRVLAAAPRGFKTNEYLKSEKPKLHAVLVDKYGSAGIESLTRYLAPQLVKACGTCGGETKWSGTLKAFASYCSLKCSNSSPEVKVRKAEANMKKFGVPHAAQSAKAKAKTRKTCLAKYGVEHPGLLESSRIKRKATYFERTGYETPFENPEAQGKARKTLVKRYGVARRQRKN